MLLRSSAGRLRKREELVADVWYEGGCGLGCWVEMTGCGCSCWAKIGDGCGLRLFASFELAKRTAISKRSTAERSADVVISATPLP